MECLNLTSLILVLLTFSIANISGQYEDTTENLLTVIGIDLGTTYSRVGVYQNGAVEILRNSYGNILTPSYVAYTHNNEILIGEEAKDQIIMNPENTIFDIMKIIGRRFDEAPVQYGLKHFPFKLINKSNRPYVKIKIGNVEKLLSAEEIVAMILRDMRTIAEGFLEKEVRHAVVTVPSCFNSAQRQAILDAGTISGLEIMSLINAPVAATKRYIFDWQNVQSKFIVFDLGGGTLDISIVRSENGFTDLVTSNGNLEIGGTYFDQRVVEYFVKLYQERNGIDISIDKRAIQRLRLSVENAKGILSRLPTTKIEIESFFDEEKFSEILTRDLFETLNNDFFLTIIDSIDDILAEVSMSREEIDAIVLLGGSSHIPKLQELIKNYFNGKELIINLDDGHAVLYGTTLEAAITMGVRFVSYKYLSNFQTTAFDVSVKTVEGVKTKLLSKNTIMPLYIKHVFTTSTDNQSNLQIYVYENISLLGIFNIFGIPRMGKGIPQIEVFFAIDINGVLNVSAKETRSSFKRLTVTQKDSIRLKEDEIMIMDDYPIRRKFADDLLQGTSHDPFESEDEERLLEEDPMDIFRNTKNSKTEQEFETDNLESVVFDKSLQILKGILMWLMNFENEKTFMKIERETVAKLSNKKFRLEMIKEFVNYLENLGLLKTTLKILKLIIIYLEGLDNPDTQLDTIASLDTFLAWFDNPFIIYLGMQSMKDAFDELDLVGEKKRYFKAIKKFLISVEKYEKDKNLKNFEELKNLAYESKEMLLLINMKLMTYNNNKNARMEL